MTLERVTRNKLLWIQLSPHRLSVFAVDNVVVASILPTTQIPTLELGSGGNATTQPVRVGAVHAQETPFPDRLDRSMLGAGAAGTSAESGAFISLSAS